MSDAAGNTATSSAVVYTVSTTGPDGDRSPGLRHRHFGHRPRHRQPGRERHRLADGGALHHRRQPDRGDGDHRCTRAWSFTPSGLGDGSHTIVASQTDSFGNTGSASLSFTLDTTAPTVAITSAGGSTNQVNKPVTTPARWTSPMRAPPSPS
ncbi:Ig-like domain-containing protein [Bradyrhizobium sp. 15]|uniref:Ig-like domain-containing protein n=1 Tax=Bradyrhizobium sp. 15 TaxID=2782633 RepID=UPI00320A1FC0